MDDCLIIGGGAIGLSLAYELAGRGRSVRVIDRQVAGREASWAGAGILPPTNDVTAYHPLEKLRAISHQLHAEWSQRLLRETGIDNGYRRCGGVYVARTAGEAAALHGLAAELRELGIGVQSLRQPDLAALEPAITPTVKSAFLLPDECQIRNPRHVRALAAASAQRGVVIEENAEVTEVDIDVVGARINSVLTSRGHYQADQICFATGAWTFGLLDQLGIHVDILPIRGQIVLFKCSSPLFERVVNEGPRYLVPRDDGYVLAGSTEEEAGFDKSTTGEAIAELQQLAIELVPELKHASVERTWAGLRPGTYDGFPYIGRLPNLENGFVAAGHYRSGLHLSPGTARVMCQLMCGETPEIDLFPFRVNRGASRERQQAAMTVRGGRTEYGH